MANFEPAVEIVLANEGGLELPDIADSGNITNFGISLHFYQTIKPGANSDDIKNLTRDMAIEIYRHEFWSKSKFNMIANQAIASKVFDLSVNMGIASIVKCLQRALLATTGKNITIDGILGSDTLYSVNNSNPDILFACLKCEAASYYRELALSHPQLKKFLTGWLNRAYSNI